jgi:hypothetical protein
MPAGSAIQRLRRWRPRRLDVALVVVGVVMAVATGAEVSANYQLRSREPEDRQALVAHTREVTPGRRYGLAKVEQAIGGFDVICADRLQRPKPRYRLCLVVRRTGPLADRAVGGYFQPARAFVLKKSRYGCFGKAAGLKLCVKASRRRA